MKPIFKQFTICFALVVPLSTVFLPDAAAFGGGAAPEPGAGCEDTLGQSCMVTYGPPYVASAEITFDAETNFANFESQLGALQLGNSSCTMGNPPDPENPSISGGQNIGDLNFETLTRRNIQGFCVTGAFNECAGTQLAEVLAVKQFVGPILGEPESPFYRIEVLLLPVTCM